MKFNLAEVQNFLIVGFLLNFLTKGMDKEESLLPTNISEHTFFKKPKYSFGK